MTVPRRFVTAPPITPAPYGLLSAATVIEAAADERTGFGTIYQPDYCGPAWATAGPCAPDYLGTVSASVDDSRTVTLTTTADRPATLVQVDWGDSSSDALDFPDDTPWPHTYAADGTYTITFVDQSGRGSRTLTGDVTVTDGEASGPVILTGDARRKNNTDGIDTVSSLNFAVYHNDVCRLVGQSEDEAIERARRALQLGEGRAVEAAVAEQLAVAAGAGDGLLWPDPMHPVVALGYLEDYARASYGGTPVIHLPVHMTTVLSAFNAIERVGTQLQTKQGSVIASGYTDWGWPLMLPWDGDGPLVRGAEAMAYVTGQVTIRRSAIQTTPTVGGSVQSNERTTLAERDYDVSWDCITGAIQMTINPWAV